MSSLLKAENISNEGLANLMEGVINRARMDYILGADEYRKKGDNKKKAVRNRIKRFLRSDYGKLFIPAYVNPEKIIENWDEQLAYHEWRVATGCSKCESKTCVHKSFSYTQERKCTKKRRKKNEKAVQKVS